MLVLRVAFAAVTATAYAPAVAVGVSDKVHALPFIPTVATAELFVEQEVGVVCASGGQAKGDR